MRRFGKFMLLLALSVMPLHGIAATSSILPCHGEAQTHAASGHAHDTGDASHHSHDDEGGASGDAAYHLCCNLTASAPPAVKLPPAAPQFPIRAFVPDSHYDLYVPDRPQRPPLA